MKLGDRYHPQLRRFQDSNDPERAIAAYLLEVWEESRRRGCHFDRKKIKGSPMVEKIPVTRGQLYYEFELLCRKLNIRNNDRCEELRSVKEVECHPLFEVIEGEIEKWEKQLDIRSYFNDP